MHVRIRWWLPFAMAGALTTAACLAPHRHGQADSASSAVPATATRTFSGPAPIDEQRLISAQQKVSDLLQLFVAALPTGATPLATAPSSAVDWPATIPGPNLVEMTRWFSVPGSPQQVLDGVAARSPAGLHRNGGHGDGPGYTDVEDDYNGTETHEYAAPRIEVLAVAFGQLTSVRLDVSTTWRPGRTPAELVPTGVTGMTITYSPASSGSRTLEFGEAQARRIASRLNGLDTAIPFPHECMSPSAFTIVFAGTSETFVEGPCAWVAVTAGGADQPALEDFNADGESALRADLEALFGVG